LRAGNDRLRARITRRTAPAIALYEGSAGFTVPEPIAVAQAGIGPGLQS